MSHVHPSTHAESKDATSGMGSSTSSAQPTPVSDATCQAPTSISPFAVPLLPVPDFVDHPRFFLRARPWSQRERTMYPEATHQMSRIRLNNNEIRFLEEASGTGTGTGPGPSSVGPESSFLTPPRLSIADASEKLYKSFGVDGVITPAINVEQIRSTLLRRVLHTRLESHSWPVLAHRILPQRSLPSDRRCHFDSLPTVLVSLVCQLLSYSDLRSFIPVNRHVRDAGLQPTSWSSLIHDIDSEQELVYQRTTRSCVEDFILHGISGCVWAVGRTGNGKTLTMQGVGRDIAHGIIRRASHDLFELVDHELATPQAKEQQLEACIRISSIMIEKDGINDMLPNPLHTDANGWQTYPRIEVKESPPCNLLLPDLTYREVRSEVEMTQAIHESSRAIKIDQTRMGRSSSSATTIISFHIDFRTRHGSMLERKATLHFIDAAGWETYPTRPALLNCVNALSDMSTRTSVTPSGSYVHVPFRDSKLTRLMASALAGRQRCVFIGHISTIPTIDAYDHALTQGRFASRLRTIIKPAALPGSPSYTNTLQLKLGLTPSEWHAPDPWSNKVNS